MEKRTTKIIKSNMDLLRLGFLVVAFSFAYFDTFVSLVKTWSSRNDYSHGFIVPFASLYFVYAMRDKIRTVSFEPNITLGMVVTLTGVLVLMLGKTGGMMMIQQLSILVVLTGMIIMLLGLAMLKALLLPLGYLVLMIPLILDVIFSPLHWPFQLFGAKISAMILSALGIPVFHTDQYIELPNMPLEVANACSGIRYLVSIVALAIPLAYLTQETWSKKIVLVISSVIIGIFANPLRIAIIGVWVYNGGSILHGPGHILQGYFVSVVGFVFLFITAFILSRMHASGIQKEQINSRLRTDSVSAIFTSVSENKNKTTDLISRVSHGGPKQKVIPKIVWVFATVIMLVVGCFMNFYRPVPVYLTEHQDYVPLALDVWTGHIIEGKDDVIVKLPDPDIEILRSYRASSGETLYLKAGYYAYQSQDKKFVHYTMQNIYDNAMDCRIQVAEGHYITAKKVIINEGGKRRLVLYWYDIHGYVTSNNITAKFITAIRGIVKWQSNGSIVLIASDLNATDQVETVSGQQEKFVAAIYPFLKEYLNSHKKKNLIFFTVK
jgi:EpsI family protein